MCKDVSKYIPNTTMKQMYNVYYINVSKQILWLLDIHDFERNVTGCLPP